MKIAVRGGHNFQATGASALIDETTEDRKVYKAVVKYLRALGHNILDVTPNDCDVYTDLEYGVNRAENFGADLFISVHFDKCFDSYEGALGTATWVYGNGRSTEVAQRIVNSVASGTGLKNRGVRTNPKLYELRKTSMRAVIVETCFCEATDDIKIYKEKGYDLIGKLIAEGIANAKVENQPTVINDNSKYGIVTANVLNVRKGAGTDYEVVGQVHKGDKIKLDCKVGDWWSTYYGEHGGFMYADYLDIV